ncbi:MAG: VWA domain-containing protein [Armatimonadaceae bacterium]
MNGQPTQALNTPSFDPNRTQAAPPPDYAGPATVPALTLSVLPGNRLAYSSEQSRQHLMTQVAVVGGGGISTGQRLPVNLGLVIDRSGSMEGEPLEYVKRACNYVVDMLTPEDVLTIVTFEETVEVLMPARRVTDPNLIKQHIARIVAGNTTNLFDGLYAAGSQVGSIPLGGYTNRILLLTDGEPTAGLKDFTSIVNQVAELKSRGITVTALGFGPEYNEELMAGIARRSGGNYYFIARPEEIPDVFRKEVEQALGVTARNVRLTMHLPRGCTVRQVYGTQPAHGARSTEINLGDLERGATITKLWEMDLESRRPAMYRIAKAVLTWNDAGTGAQHSTSENVVIEFTRDAAAVPGGVDPVVAQELSVVMASRDLEKTMMGMRTQQISVSDITRALEKTQQLLNQQGRMAEAQEVAEATRAMQRGDNSVVEKTLIGTIYNLDQGRRRS